MTWLERLGEALARDHGALAVLLYGSHARGAARPESDVDVVILVPRRDGANADDGDARTRDARQVPGPDGRPVDVDGWIYTWDPDHPAGGLDARKDPSLLRLRGGRALWDPDGRLPPVFAALDAQYAEGPTPLASDHREALERWSERMLRRVLDPDPARAVAAAWRRAELIVEILPDVFYVRGWWYPGPEPGLALLAERAPGIHTAFAAALAPNAGRAELEALVRACLHPPT